MEENTVNLVFGIQYWYVGMTPQDLEPETTIELLENVCLSEKQSWGGQHQKEKKKKDKDS